ncbi:hypothetical protein [Nonomuraea sp. CA-141351]|uniref:hypothetical protein n=1 Tax=Nonomuraea sp. CA-141351 TaxID=3239996 RepID=UPI003D8A1B00
MDLAGVRRRRKAHGLDHARSGELVLLAEPEAWFRAGAALLRKKLGLRYLMNVVGLDQGARAVRGSHGLLPADPADAPVLLCSDPSAGSERFEATEVKDLLLRLTLR